MGAVFFATPSFEWKVGALYHESFIDTWTMCTQVGIDARRGVVCGDCYVHKARNILVADFLDSDATELFFLDADVGWDAMAALRVLARPQEFVAGIYPFKLDNESYPVQVEQGADGLPVVDPATGLISLLMAPTGFMRLRRSVFEKLAPLMDYYVVEGRRVIEFFKTPNIDHVFHGEDPNFCRGWIGIGGKIWCEPDIEFTHSGHKAWKGNFRPYMDRVVAKQKRALPAAPALSSVA